MRFTNSSVEITKLMRMMLYRHKEGSKKTSNERYLIKDLNIVSSLRFLIKVLGGTAAKNDFLRIYIYIYIYIYI